MARFQYGEGKLKTQQGITSDGLKCLTITRCEQRPVGSIEKDWDKQTPEDEHDVVLTFINIEGARVLQDELNDLISTWSRESGPKV